MTVPLPYPPVATAFLALFPGHTDGIIWENPSLGLFGIVVRGRDACFTLPDVPSTTTPQTVGPPHVTEDATKLVVPNIPADQRCTSPPVCMHGSPGVSPFGEGPPCRNHTEAHRHSKGLAERGPTLLCLQCWSPDSCLTTSVRLPTREAAVVSSDGETNWSFTPLCDRDSP